jgi:hypothetical protein
MAIKSIYKGEVLTRTKVINKIVKIYTDTTEDERFDWYQDAKNKGIEIAKNNNAFVPLWGETAERVNSKVWGVIAALSPVKTWSQNLIQAEQFYKSGDCGHMGQFKTKARKIMQSDGSDESILEILKGRKISAFYMNIKYPHHGANVTIDRHALSICLGKWVTDEEYSGMTASQYGFFQNCYILASVKLDTTPLLVQSSTWVRFRKIKHTYKTNR